MGRSLADDWATVRVGGSVSPLQHWNETATRDIIEKISRRVRAQRPGTRISVAAVPFDHDRVHEGVDALSWTRDGLVDQVYYMAYGTPPDIDAVTHAWREIPSGHFTVLLQNYRMIGEHASNHSGRLLVDYARLLQEFWPGSGLGLYHFPHLDAEQATALGGLQGISAAGQHAPAAAAAQR
jgi:hypothetical protein